MLPLSRHPLYYFHFKSNLKYGEVHCEYKFESSKYIPQDWPYFHHIINQNIIKLRKPYIWFKNKKNQNIIYNLKFYNYNLVTHSPWHIGTRSVYDGPLGKSDNFFIDLINLVIAIIGSLIWGINIIVFKVYAIYNRNNSSDDDYGFHFKYRNVIENKLDEKGRTIYIKSKKESYVSFDKILTSNITYDTENHTYIEELTITYLKFEGWIGPVPNEEKMKLIVYPYYESENKPYWYNCLNDDWHNCLIFESLNEDRLKYIITKPNDKIS